MLASSPHALHEFLARLCARLDGVPEAEEELRELRAIAAEAKRVEIEEKVEQAEADVLAHFDDEVRQRFAKYGEAIPAALSRMEYWLWELTKCRLRDRASFDEAKRHFVLHKPPYPDLRPNRLVFGRNCAAASPTPRRSRNGRPAMSSASRRTSGRRNWRRNAAGRRSGWPCSARRFGVKGTNASRTPRDGPSAAFGTRKCLW